MKPELAAIAGLMLSAVLACSLPGQSADISSQEVTETEERVEEAEAPPTEAPPVEEVSPTAEMVMLDTCDLLAPDDVATVLGEAATGTYDPNFASCTYTSSSGQYLIVIAYQGEMARDRTSEGMVLALQQFGDSAAQQLYDEIEPQLATMSMAEMADAFATVEEAMGRDVTSHPELGDAGYLVWIDNGIAGSAQLGVVRGETVTSVVTIGVDRAIAEANVLSVTEIVWERLPERFTPALN